MMEIPFFLPSSHGPLGAVAHLPEDDARTDAAVLLLAGGRAGKALLRRIASDLAAERYRCLRFDYPGSGVTPKPDPLTSPKLVSLASEVAGWWRRITGVEHLALVGHCLGARLGISVAAVETGIEEVLGIYLPMAKPSVASRLLNGARALDARGPRLASRFIQAPRVLERGSGPEVKAGSLEEDLESSTPTRYRFLYGSDDPAYAVFAELLAGASDDVRQRVNVSLLPGARLHGILNVDNDPWIRSEISEALRP